MLRGRRGLDSILHQVLRYRACLQGKKSHKWLRTRVCSRSKCATATVVTPILLHTKQEVVLWPTNWRSFVWRDATCVSALSFHLRPRHGLSCIEPTLECGCLRRRLTLRQSRVSTKSCWPRVDTCWRSQRPNARPTNIPVSDPAKNEAHLIHAATISGRQVDRCATLVGSFCVALLRDTLGHFVVHFVNTFPGRFCTTILNDTPCI